MAVILPPGAINTGEPVVPRPSATVVLIRGSRPWELLLVRRPGGADFAPGAYVFPGGTVHAGDRGAADEIKAAGLRELFEEAGILLARRGRAQAKESDCVLVRARIAQGDTFTAALAACGLTPAFDRLVPLARWVTPAVLSRRYDARFYLARMPAGQSVLPQEGEVVDWLWTTPARALEDPAITLVYATRSVLETVATGESASAIFARARNQREVPVVEPRMVETESGWVVER
ncbi:MAG TPA: NUDIX hydrolase [Candidatus Dormibacteraeota bacterium]|nr:NUDIX hydrolase [Candidatus Dormibacteraeota bacterium]